MLAQRLATQRLARGVIPELDACFAALDRGSGARVMTSPTTAREALIVEALGDAARLIRQVEALAPVMDQSRQALADAHSGLADRLAAFEAQVVALTGRPRSRP